LIPGLTLQRITLASIIVHCLSIIAL